MDRPLDVAFWVEPFMLGRESTFARHLVMGLKSEGQQATFIAPQGVDLLRLPTLGSRVVHFRWHRWEKLAFMQRLRFASVIEQLAKSPPDVIVAWAGMDATLCQGLALVSQAHNIPIIAWVWDASELFGPMMKVAGLAHVVVASQSILDRVPKDLHVGATLIHPGVYTEEAIACYDVEGQMPCLVSLDPLSDVPAYEALIRACRMVADAGEDFLLFAFDQGRQEHPIWQLAEKLGLLDRMSFVPFQQEAEPLLLHGDLYLHVLPTGRVMYRTLEAMGRGLAVVTCMNHGADYLVDGQTCRIVGPQTPEAWRDVLLELLRDRAKAAGIARRGQQYVREKHAMGRMLEQFGSICRQVVGAPIPIARFASGA